MNVPKTLTLLLSAALLSSAAWAQTLPPEKPMKSTDKTAKANCGDARDKGNAGTAYGPGAKAVGGTGNRGRNTGNGGVAIGSDADASGGNNNTTDPECAGDGVRSGNGGVAKGQGAKANGGNGNTIKF